MCLHMSRSAKSLSSELNVDGSSDPTVTTNRDTEIIAFLTAISSIISPDVAPYAMLTTIESVLKGASVLDCVPLIQDRLVKEELVSLSALELEMLITAAGGGHDGFSSKVRFNAIVPMYIFVVYIYVDI